MTLLGCSARVSQVTRIRYLWSPLVYLFSQLQLKINTSRKPHRRKCEEEGEERKREVSVQLRVDRREEIRLMLSACQKLDLINEVRLIPSDFLRSVQPAMTRTFLMSCSPNEQKLGCLLTLLTSYYYSFSLSMFPLLLIRLLMRNDWEEERRLKKNGSNNIGILIANVFTRSRFQARLNNLEFLDWESGEYWTRANDKFRSWYVSWLWSRPS